MMCAVDNVTFLNMENMAEKYTTSLIRWPDSLIKNFENETEIAVTGKNVMIKFRFENWIVK